MRVGCICRRRSLPFSLIRWEMTGQTDEMEWLLADDNGEAGS